jgi:hypothetical protein
MKTEFPDAGTLFKAGQLPSLTLALVGETLKRIIFLGMAISCGVRFLRLGHPKVS